MTDEGRELQPAKRFEWERVLRRCKLHRDVKLVGFTMAQFGNKDGTNVRPGTQRIANACDLSERTVKRHIAVLVDLGMIERISNGGGPNGKGALYRLTIPSDLMERVELTDPGERTRAKSAPVKPVDNHPDLAPVLPLNAGELGPSENELGPSGAELGPNTASTGAIDPPVTCDVLRHQETKERRPPKQPPRTSPDVSTSPARSRADPNSDVDVVGSPEPTAPRPPGTDRIAALRTAIRHKPETLRGAS